jgi:hypothetical protein
MKIGVLKGFILDVKQEDEFPRVLLALHTPDGASEGSLSPDRLMGTLEPTVGFEPTTHALRKRCSTS